MGREGLFWVGRIRVEGSDRELKSQCGDLFLGAWGLGLGFGYVTAGIGPVTFYWIMECLCLDSFTKGKTTHVFLMFHGLLWCQNSITKFPENSLWENTK